jgi:hypothetical protein
LVCLAYWPWQDREGLPVLISWGIYCNSYCL